ncbi:hypothetical protein FRC03_002379 [Tulasnella sp. 419]|nr:hypothetical protein FRC03_002379 [Tulasnella sp. 419]
MVNIGSPMVLNTVLNATPYILYFIVLPFSLAFSIASLVSRSRSRAFSLKISGLALAVGILYSTSGLMGLVSVINSPVLGGVGNGSTTSNNWPRCLEILLHSCAFFLVNCLLLYVFLVIGTRRLRVTENLSLHGAKYVLVIILAMTWLIISLGLSIAIAVLLSSNNQFTPLTRISTAFNLLSPIVTVAPLLFRHPSSSSDNVMHLARDLEARPRLTGLQQVLHEGPAFAKALQFNRQPTQETSTSTLVLPSRDPFHSGSLTAFSLPPMLGSTEKCSGWTRSLILVSQSLGLGAGIFDTVATMLLISDGDIVQRRHVAVAGAYIVKAILEQAWLLGSLCVMYSVLFQSNTILIGEEHDHISSGYEGSILASSSDPHDRNGSRFNDPLRSVSEEFLDVQDPFSCPPPGSTVVLSSVHKARPTKSRPKGPKKSKNTSRRRLSRPPSPQLSAGPSGMKLDYSRVGGESEYEALEADMNVHEALAYILRADAETAAAAESRTNALLTQGSSKANHVSKKLNLNKPILVAKADSHSSEALSISTHDAPIPTDSDSAALPPSSAPISMDCEALQSELMPTLESFGNPHCPEGMELDHTVIAGTHAGLPGPMGHDDAINIDCRLPGPAQATAVVATSSSGKFANQPSLDYHGSEQAVGSKSPAKRHALIKEKLKPSLRKMFRSESDGDKLLSRVSRDEGDSIGSGGDNRASGGSSLGMQNEALLGMVVMNALGIKESHGTPSWTHPSLKTKDSGGYNWQIGHGEASSEALNAVLEHPMSDHVKESSGTRGVEETAIHHGHSPTYTSQDTSVFLTETDPFQTDSSTRVRPYICIPPPLSLLKSDLPGNTGRASRSGSQTPTPMNQVSGRSGSQLCRSRATSPELRHLPEDSDGDKASLVMSHDKRPEKVYPFASFALKDGSRLSVSELVDRDDPTSETFTSSGPRCGNLSAGFGDSPSTQASSLGAFVYTHHPHVSSRVVRPPTSRTLTLDLQIPNPGVPNVKSQTHENAKHSKKRTRSLSFDSHPDFSSPIPIPPVKVARRDPGFNTINTDGSLHRHGNQQSQMSTSEPSKQVLRSHFSWSDTSSLMGDSKITNNQSSSGDCLVFPSDLSDERGRSKVQPSWA